MRLESGYPEHLRIGTADQRATEYVRATELVAVHADPANMPKGAVQLLEDDSIGVFPADSLPTLSGPIQLGAVYLPARQKGSNVAVPTGRVLIRFLPGDTAAEHAAEIERAGYRIEEILSYAPEAAWLTAAAGGIAPALQRLNQLEIISNVQHVEPQLLRPAARRK